MLRPIWSHPECPTKEDIQNITARFPAFLLQCPAELGHEGSIDHSSEARHNAALQETFVYRT